MYVRVHSTKICFIAVGGIHTDIAANSVFNYGNRDLVNIRRHHTVPEAVTAMKIRSTAEASNKLLRKLIYNFPCIQILPLTDYNGW